MSSITVYPVKKFTRDIMCAPDKSMTHRALMFCSVAEGRSEVKGILSGGDCLSTLNCMRRAGAEIELKGDRAYIIGNPRLKSADLYAGNSGTTMRLMCGLLAAKEGEWTIAGDESLSARPMDRVITPLSLMGGRITSQNGKAPLRVLGGKLHGADIIMDVASAQVKSAVILAAMGAEGVTRITEWERTRDHTEIMLASMGVDICADNGVITVNGDQTPRGVSVTIAGDISSAAFPLVCGLMTGGEVTVRNVGLNPTRAGILEVFDQIGVDYSVDDVKYVCGEKTGVVTVRGLGDGKPFAIDKSMMPRLVDEIPVLAVLACRLSGDSVITGAEELRVKESDRISATVKMIRAFGGRAGENPDGFTVSGSCRLKGGCVFDPRGDHRMAMSAAVAAAASDGGARILGGECAVVSYPGFWEMLAGKTS